MRIVLVVSYIFISAVAFAEEYKLNIFCGELNHIRTCNYKIGNKLKFSILGVGTDIPRVNINKSDRDDSHFVSISPTENCVFVHAGEKQGRARGGTIAAVSITTGAVTYNFKEFRDCGNKKQNK